MWGEYRSPNSLECFNSWGIWIWISCVQNYEVLPHCSMYVLQAAIMDYWGKRIESMVLKKMH